MNLSMNFGKLISRSSVIRKSYLKLINSNCRLLSKASEEKAPSELYSVRGDDNLKAYLEEKEAEIEAKRNKSMLRPQHHNILHGKVPYNEPVCDIHSSLRYKKRMFGRYGYESGVNPGALWPSTEEIEERMEYEKVAYPYTIPEMWEKVRQRREEEEKQYQKGKLNWRTMLKSWINGRKKSPTELLKSYKQLRLQKQRKMHLLKRLDDILALKLILEMRNLRKCYCKKNEIKRKIKSRTG
uniref:Large ribosomal subunit protein mL64 n=1 Tax=Rhodnius prolixus TaxID=13249 RepID=A0A4P6D8X1_RHOPR